MPEKKRKTKKKPGIPSRKQLGTEFKPSTPKPNIPKWDGKLYPYEYYLIKSGIGRPSEYNPEVMIPIIIEEMREGACVEEVCPSLGITKETFYQWVKSGGIGNENPKKPNKYKVFSDAFKTGKALCEAWWLKQGRGNLRCPKEFNTALYFINMKNRFDWNDRKPSYPIKKIPDFEGTLEDKSKAVDKALKRGIITTDEHNLLFNSLLAEARILEISSLQKRIEEIETFMEKK